MPNALTKLALALLFLLAGCNAYRLGNGTELPFRTVFVEPVINRSLAPQAQALLSEAISRELAKRHGISLASSSQKADAVLRVTLTDYQRPPGIRSSADTTVPISQDLTLRAKLSLAKPDGSFWIQDRPVTSSQQALSIGSFSNNEYQAMVPLTDSLAKAIVDEVTSVW